MTGGLGSKLSGCRALDLDLEEDEAPKEQQVDGIDGLPSWDATSILRPCSAWIHQPLFLLAPFLIQYFCLVFLQGTVLYSERLSMPLTGSESGRLVCRTPRLFVCAMIGPACICPRSPGAVPIRCGRSRTIDYDEMEACHSSVIVRRLNPADI